MTAPHTGPLPSAPPLGTVVTGSLPVAVTVTAVIVTRGRSPFLPATLDAVRAQVHAPDEVVVVDVDTAPATSAHPDLVMAFREEPGGARSAEARTAQQLGGARYVAAAGARTFGEGVDAALRAVGISERSWLWLLHDDSAPAPGALAALMRAVEHASSVAVAGSKQRRWEVSGTGEPLDPAAADRGVLVEVGHTVSPLGRRMTGVDESEIDQGQHDAREDVLAVGLAGALVRGVVWRHLGGTDPAYGVYGDSTDFCRRVRLAGHRVVVVPQAVVRHAQASLRGLREPGAGADDRSRGPRRRSQLHLRLVSAPAVVLPVVALAMLVWAPFQAAYRLALKHPAEARDELLAPVWAVSRLAPVVRARRAAARTSTVPRGVLRPLTGTWREVWSEYREGRLSRAERLRTHTVPSELEQAEQRRVATRRRGVLALVFVAATTLAAWVFGPALGVLASGGRLTGGSLLATGGTVGDVWTAATSGWVRDGLGVAAPPDPLLLPLAGLTALAGGSLTTAVDLLFVAALPLAALGAWAASGAVTRSPGLRAWAALLWVAAPALLGAVDAGRVGSVVAHLALPWAALALARAAGVQALDRLPDGGADPGAADAGAAAPGSSTRSPTGSAAASAADDVPRPGPSLGAAGAAGLLLAVAVCGAPILLPVAVVVLAVAALGARRRGRYLVLALVPSLMVGAPFWWAAARSADGLRLLLAEPAGAPGVAAVPGQPLGLPGLGLLLGRPSEPGTWFAAPELGSDGLSGVVGVALRGLAVAGPFVTGAVVVVIAVVALFRRRGAAARLGWFVAAAGLVTALLAQGAFGGGAGWAGPGLSLVLLGLATAALRGAPVRRGGRAARLAGVTMLGAVAVLAPAADVASWVADLGGSIAAEGRADALHPAVDPVVPAVGRQMQAPPREARVLQLDVAAAGGVEYTPLRGDGSLLLDASAAAVLSDGAAAWERLDGLAAELTAGTAPDLADRLAALGFGAVQVRSDGVAATEDLVATLDMVPGLARVIEGQEVSLWRVAPGAGPAPGWARLELPADAGGDAAGTTTAVLPARGAAVDTQVDDGDAGRLLVLAESADGGWRATLDGRALETATADGLQAFALGPDGGRLVVGYQAPHRVPWLVLAGFTLAVFALLALPVGRRRVR
ncbi:glycosyltransferase [Antribacter sp. KLBMP9083]|uniref:Glycosyltransferase n=1 Tax=Antribacter soli TaxID=2910976 RepID=A0AA41QDI3_9MICO|nr:glycosyltransferase [Antribacter soli]MCF4120132.1 glycosyltransferase [Antribacter soli]